MHFVTLPSLPNSTAATKQFSIFQDCFDQTPTFRSYILNLVLRYGGATGFQLLRKYLIQAEQVLKGTRSVGASENEIPEESEIPNAANIRTDLQRIVMECIEQTCCTRTHEGKNKSDLGDLEVANSMLREVLSAGSEADEVEYLSALAKIRCSFEVFVEHLRSLIENPDIGYCLIWPIFPLK